jgi:prepilin-type N-terminal cleavage/methylation domain-containing protein
MNHYRRRSSHHASRGFTLTELMIVVSIMGLLLAVSVPGIQRYLRSWRLNGEASSMAMMMRAARSAAVNKNVDVVFADQSAGEYYYVEDADGDGTADSNEIQSGVHELSKGVSIQSFTTPQQWITFSPRGSTADGGAITVQNSYNASRTIRVFSGTGNVAVQ